MVHEGDDPDPVLGPELAQLVEQRLRAGLGPQVQVVADPQRPRRPHGEDLVGQRAGVALVVHRRARDDGAHAQRVEDGGDAGGGQLGVMGADGGVVRPVDLGARRDVAFEVVGVQLDEARADEVAVAVDRARRHGGAVVDGGDHRRRGPAGCRAAFRPAGRAWRWRARGCLSSRCHLRMQGPAGAGEKPDDRLPPPRRLLHAAAGGLRGLRGRAGWAGTWRRARAPPAWWTSRAPRRSPPRPAATASTPR